MNALKTLKPPAIACLMALPLTACLTTPTSSSLVVSETAETVQAIDMEAWCKANMPERLDELSDAEFNAMPEQAREKAVKDYKAWRSQGCG